VSTPLTTVDTDVTTAQSAGYLIDLAPEGVRGRVEPARADSKVTIPYLLVDSSEFDVESLRRPLLELVDDHPGSTCRCRFQPAGVQRGYPHHLIPAAQPWSPKGGSREVEADA